MTNQIPDLGVCGISAAQIFTRYSYLPRSHQPALFDEAEPFTRVDNVTDELQAEYERCYGGSISKDDLFYFVYGILQSPDYRKRFAADLRKALPRIPLLSSAADFRAFSEAGRQLADIHLNYESSAPYPLTETRTPGASLEAGRMRFAGKAGAWDKSTIVYNDSIKLTGIPDEAHEYMLGSRSALEWVIDRYRVKTDKDSGIVNDPNDWGLEHGDPEYILNLVKRIVTVSVETVRIVGELPALVIAE